MNVILLYLSEKNSIMQHNARVPILVNRRIHAFNIIVMNIISQGDEKNLPLRIVIIFTRT